MKRRLLITSCLTLLLAGYGRTQVTVQQLRCEQLVNPLGIDEKEPRLSWQLASPQRGLLQQSFQVLVASSLEKLNRGEGDLWNSGRIDNAASIHIVYRGKPLQSKQSCYWKVRVYTNKGVTGWSAAAHWSMGLLLAADWKAKWIGYDKTSAWDSLSQWSRLSARYLRREFRAEQGIRKATVYISGMGLYELYINGKKIGDQVLAPAPTDFRKAVLYNTYDVTRQLRTGANAVAAVLGNGRFFTMRQQYKTQKHNTFGYPKLLLQLEMEYNDGSRKTILSDESWKLTADGPIRTNNEYDGEAYDATRELTGWSSAGFNDSHWLRPELVAAPEGRLAAQMQEPVKIIRRLRPVSIKQRNGKYLLDMGQNFSGWLQLKVSGKKGTRIRLRFAESLQSGGELYVANLRDARATDVYTLSGNGTERWHPVFVYHGFRYAEIEGWPGKATADDFEGQLVSDALADNGSFVSSDETINAIYRNAWWGIASNYKGMPVDCPQRNERQPWLGDRAQGAYGESFLFGNASLYAKWLNDIEQSQTADGAIPDVAPAFWNYYSDNVTWPGTYLMVADMLYRQFGDQRAVTTHYASMKKWMRYMQDRYMKAFIVTKDKYGDWCVPPESLELIRSKDSLRNTSGELIATATYYRLLSLMIRFAALSNRQEDIRSYETLQAGIKDAFQRKFYRPAKKYYDNNTVTANLLPLYFGITPDSLKEAVFNNIYSKIRIGDRMHISTGVIGTQWLMRGLTDYNRSDIAYTLASTRTYPGWGYMVDQGATTIWELWNGNTASPQMNSQNHVMLLGDLLIWLYERVAGIRSDDTATAFRRIIMKPERIDGLQFVRASHRSPYGLITSAWKRTAGRFEWQVSIPANTSATIHIPATSLEEITENGQPVTAVPGIRFLQRDGGNMVFAIGSGTYSFVSALPFRSGIVEDRFIFKEAPFPESHAATIASTPTGLVAGWFGGTKEGNRDVCIWTSRLQAGSWTKPQLAADGIMNDSLRYPCYNPVLFYAPDKELLLFYKIGPNVAGWTGWMKRSKDNGLTWSDREPLPPGFLGPVKNKPLYINGQLVCPSSTEQNGWKVHMEMTPDFGKTWTKTADLNDGKQVSAIQPSLLTYADGSWQVLCRSRNRTINQAWSRNGGKTWEPMTATELPNNNSGTDAVTLMDGRQLLVYNHVKPPSAAANGKGARTPLNVAISKDGIHWDAVLTLEESPVNQYSYPSVIQTADGMVHIVYTWRRERIKYVSIDPSKLKGKAIVSGAWPGWQYATGKPSDD
ncbi:family 78 glycoside hydrolase catalytic domain [Sediminibacterium soli]|uniref:family 78 glycoside hydrolase catalytic domain n=1 Tax=Sediminibacterium soli TaxID=2698829 RepID=UPI00137A4D39|nr:family 78 glycoside hydrolase catalytic domain [Sediminibacterium soli]NCI48185.1 family 78 glycoside hydrolase catalytic domain [Sediminibacterium soli]